MRYFYFLMFAILMALVFGSPAEATKSSYTCANFRCATGSCVDTPSGPICQAQTLSCANVLCAQGNQCTETSTGPQCVPASSPPGYYLPGQPDHNPPLYNPPNYSPPTYNPPQSCAYGGYYQYGHLICHPAPSWRQPYQGGWGYYNAPPRYYNPPTYHQPVRPRPPWHPSGPEIVQPSPNPNPTMCTMQYDPVCAEKPVVCVRAPCPAIKKTFSNACMARAEEYTVLYKGQCN